MPFESLLRTDLLPDDLKEVQPSIKLEVETQFNLILNNTDSKSKTPGSAKNIKEVMDLVKDAVVDYELREHRKEGGKVIVTYEYPEINMEKETITISLEKREPGIFGQGAPFEGTIKNRRPILREVVEDPDNPGYKLAVLGLWHDNLLRLTCWARTNKAANDRALWLENVMEEYTWYFRMSGVNRILYEGRTSEQMRWSQDNYVFGRALDYFVRTETITTVSQKKLEQIYIRTCRMTV